MREAVALRRRGEGFLFRRRDHALVHLENDNSLYGAHVAGAA